MTDKKFRYRLSNKPKLTCPGCGRPRRFCAYVDTQTGEPVDREVVGKCDRIYNCGYHVSPSEYFKTHGYKKNVYKPKTNQLMKQMEQRYEEYRPLEATVESTKRYDLMKNPLYRYMYSLCPYKWNYGQLKAIFDLYNVGTSRKWNMSTIFWLCDDMGVVRDGKIMGYDAETGHRIKEPQSQITWCSSVEAELLKKRFFPTQKPLFGEHLLGKNLGGVVLVFESEKTALLAAMVLRRFLEENFYYHILPTSCSGLMGLTNNKMDKLRSWLEKGGSPILNQSRHVILVPDNGTYTQWVNASCSIGRGGLLDEYVHVSDVMEQERIDDYEVQTGDDLGDVIAYYYKNFSADVANMASYLLIVNLINNQIEHKL